MALISKFEPMACEKKVTDRREKTMAARLLSHYLGIQTEPVVETVALNEKSSRRKIKPYSSRFFKDIIEFGIRGEAQKIQLQVVDGKGSVIAESKGVFPPNEATDLLKKLPLPLSPQAPPWLKDYLREDCLAINLTKKETKC